MSGWMAQLLRRETSCLEPPPSGFTDLGSIPDQGKYHECPSLLTWSKDGTPIII